MKPTGRNPQRLLQEAIQQFEAGNLPGAGQLCDQVLQRLPRQPDALHIRGLVHLRQGEPAAAVPYLERALATDAGNAQVRDSLSLALLMSAQYAAAEQVLREQVSRGGANWVHALRYGIAIAAQGRLEEALPWLQQAADTGPDIPDTHYNLGKAMLDLGRRDDAAPVLERALAIAPGHSDALNARGTLRAGRGEYDAAIADYRAAIATHAAHAEAWHNLGTALHEQGHLTEAETALRRAIELRPDYARAWNSLAVLHGDVGREGEARHAHEQVLAVGSHLSTVRYNAALWHLQHGDFAQGWDLYEARFEADGVAERLRHRYETVRRFAGKPAWDGEPASAAAGLAIVAEQGIGDQLLFSTLLPEVASRAGDWVCEVDGRLLSAYQRALPQGRFIAMQDPPDSRLADSPGRIWMGSLPRLFRRSTGDFARQTSALLTALPEKVAQRRADLGIATLRVGLSWRSSRSGRVGAKKSLAIERYAPFFEQTAISFVDLQYGDTAPEREWLAGQGHRLYHADDFDYFNDLEDMLALIQACDLVITTSNVNAHFAGVLGKEAWLLMPDAQVPFHYWSAVAGDRSLWYPSLTLIRGTGWDEVIAAAAARLRERAGT